MRNIVDVINEMLEVVPESETKLRQGLVVLRESAWYAWPAPPEGVPDLWRRGSRLLTDAIGTLMRPEPAGSWCQRVADIWSGKPVT